MTAWLESPLERLQILLPSCTEHLRTQILPSGPDKARSNRYLRLGQAAHKSERSYAFNCVEHVRSRVVFQEVASQLSLAVAEFYALCNHKITILEISVIHKQALGFVGWGPTTS